MSLLGKVFHVNSGNSRWCRPNGLHQGCSLDVRSSVASNRLGGAQLLGYALCLSTLERGKDGCRDRILASVLLADIMPQYAPGLLRFEHSLADTRTSALSDQLASQHPHVAITDQTLSEYKTRLPIDRALLARLVEAIDTAGA